MKTIAEVKKSVKIPVIANGDITGGKSAEYMKFIKKIQEVVCKS